MTIDKEYMEILKNRMEHFKGKEINDLSDEEINEYLNLRKEVRENFEWLTDAVASAWEEIYGDSWKKYKERVLNRE